MAYERRTVRGRFRREGHQELFGVAPKWYAHTKTPQGFRLIQRLFLLMEWLLSRFHAHAR